jgi:hypothetical protein
MWCLAPNPAESWRNGEKGDILFLQGFNEKWTFASTIGNELNKNGYRIHVVKELGWNLKELNESASIVKAYIRKNHLKNFIVISHSKGGLLAKMMLDDEEIGPKVLKVIAIAPPFHGTILGYFHIFHLDQLVPTSSLISLIMKEKKNYKKITVLHSIVDNLVIPNSSYKVDGIKTIQIDTVGHTEILDNKKTINTIKTLIS